MTFVLVVDTTTNYVISTSVYIPSFVEWCKSFDQSQRSYNSVKKTWSFIKESVGDSFLVMLEVECEINDWSLVLDDAILDNKVIKFTQFMESRYLRVLNPIPRSVYNEFISHINLPLLKYYDLKKRLKEIRSKGWKIYLNDLAKNVVYTNQDLVSEQVDFNMKIPMYPFQEFNAKFLKNGGLEASQTGLGKTIILIGILSRHFVEGNVDKILVITLKSVIKDWVKRFDEFAPHLNYTVVTGTKKKRTKLWGEDTQVHITNYEIARNDIKIQRKLQQWDGIVVDECQSIKNWDSKQAKAIKSVRPRYRWAVSATPMENKPQDIYSIISWIKPDLFGNFERFRTKYMIEEEVSLRDDTTFRKLLGYKNLGELSARLSGVMVRQLATEISTELPEIIEQKIYVDPTSEQLKFTKYIKELLRAGEVTTISTLVAFRQIGADPMLLWNSTGEMASMIRDQLDEPPAKPSTKTIEIVKRCFILQEEGKKVVVFANFVTYLKRIAEALKDEKVTYVEYHGDDVNIDEESIGKIGQNIFIEMGSSRKTSLEIFTNDPTVTVLLCSKAGAIGMDGLQNLSSHVIHADQAWTEAGNDQRTGRLRRFGQKSDTVVSATFITTDTYDERVDFVVAKKGAIFKQIMAGSTETKIHKAIIDDWIKE